MTEIGVLALHRGNVSWVTGGVCPVIKEVYASENGRREALKQRRVYKNCWL